MALSLLCLQDVNGPPRELRPRLCHLRKGPQGYGFNLHSDKSRPGQYIRSVDLGSPAAHSGLRAQDRLIEVLVTEASGCWVPSVCLCPCRHLHVCTYVTGVCLGPNPPWEEGRSWEPELAFLLLLWLVTTLMNI